VLKANAYGHGAVLVAGTIGHEPNVPFFAVDSHFEAEQLRAGGVTKPLLVLGFSRTETIMRSGLRDVAFTISSRRQFDDLLALNATRTVHLKFDTGMHRQGIPWSEAYQIIERVRGAALNVEGILTHFAESESDDSKLTAQQIERWNNIARRFKSEYPSIKHYHAANSGGFRHAKNIVANAGRAGIALYGINPGNLAIPLRPALRMLSLVSDVRVVSAGESVGYSATFTATKETKLATVPVGYYEGVDRRLSNKGAYLIDGKEAPLRGRVSMNISSCEVASNVNVGDEVVIVSDKRDDANSAERIAKLCDTIPYEILVHIPAHLRRVVIN
jgi:alanine racemase